MKINVEAMDSAKMAFVECFLLFEMDYPCDIFSTFLYKNSLNKTGLVYNQSGNVSFQ